MEILMVEQFFLPKFWSHRLPFATLDSLASFTYMIPYELQGSTPLSSLD
jgi:hypothetical protein